MIDNYGLQVLPDARFSVWLRHADLPTIRVNPEYLLQFV